MSESSRPPNTLRPAEIDAALAGTQFAGSLHHLPEVDSTNNLALHAALAGATAGVWVADAQTAGRGRGGHTWLSGPGDGLYVTALVTPALPASALELSLAAGLAAWEAIRDVSGLTVDIRWPNDLVTRPQPAAAKTAGAHINPSRKLGGVLVETALDTPRDPAVPAQLRYAVIGIGINVAHTAFPPGLASLATSLRLEGWTTPDRQPLLVALLRRLDLHLRTLETQYAAQYVAPPAGPGLTHGPALLSQLGEASTWLQGKRVHVPEDGGYTGTTAGLDPQGFLRVTADDGTRRTVRSGGVRELDSL